MFVNIFILFIGVGILGMFYVFKEVCKVLVFVCLSIVFVMNVYLENEGFG